MKDPKPTKKELATQTRDLEEQLTRLKNRLNGQVFKKTKHGYRLDQLNEGAQRLGRRVGELEQQLANLSKAQQELAEKWQDLGRDTEPEKNKEQEPGSKKRLKEKLLKLKASVSNLSLLQKQIGQTLSRLQNDVSLVGNVRDDLKLETDQLRSQVRKLEENSSRLAVNQSTQEARTRELEDLLAELTLKQEKLSREEKIEPEKAAQQPDETISPLREQLQQQLGEHTSEDIGRHKEVDRRLQELANRIGDLGGHFNNLKQDIADQRQKREYLKQELDLRLQQLEKRIAGIDTLETQFGASLRSEADALWQKLQEKGVDLDNLRERLDILSDSEQGPDLNQKLSGVEAEVNRLSEAEDFLQESFQGLGGLELNLTSRLDDIQRQLQEHIGHNREFEEAVHRLSGEFGELNGNLQRQIEQADRNQQDKFDALEQKQALLTDWELSFNNHRQKIDNQLDRIETSVTTEQERISQLEEQFARASDEDAAQAIEVEQARRLQLELQSRFEDLNEDFANQTEQSASLSARVEEQSGQLQALTDRVDEQSGQQSALLKERESNGRSNQYALIALLLFGLLGGALLYFSNLGKIAESEQRITQQLTSLDSSYVTQKDLADRLQTLQSSLTSNIGKSAETETDLTSKSLLERQGNLEQQLTDFEVKLNLLAGSDSSKIQQQELERIQLEIDRINTHLAQLATKPSAEAGEARLAAVESTLGKTLDQLSGRISQLEARPDPDTERIAGIEQTSNEIGEQLKAGIAQLNNQQNAIGKIERSLSDAGDIFEKRLNKLETDSTGTNEMLGQLQSQVQALAAARESSAQKIVSPGKNTSAAIWQTAADARRYTIQLAGSRSKSSLIAFASDHSIESDAAYFRTAHEGRDWFILLYGRYSSFTDASKALESLPPALSRYSPWIRRIPSDAEFVVR